MVGRFFDLDEQLLLGRAGGVSDEVGGHGVGDDEALLDREVPEGGAEVAAVEAVARARQADDLGLALLERIRLAFLRAGRGPELRGVHHQFVETDLFTRGRQRGGDRRRLQFRALHPDP